MNLQDKLVRGQLEITKPIADNASLEFSRNCQNKIGKLMHFAHRHDVVISDKLYQEIPGSLVIPHTEKRSGIILYLHGGGYTCGALDYARGVSSILSAECGMRVFCLEYRLAPENPYPAALDDALSAYKQLLTHGYEPSEVVLAGESAGGGLAYALALKLRELGEAMPAGIIAISPWCDLTLSGKSYDDNHEHDPSLTKNRLRFFADCYVGATKVTPKQPVKADASMPDDYIEQKRNPYVSPIFADLKGLPPSIIYVGSDEILLSDAINMRDNLSAAGCDVTLYERADMWHAYLVYGLKSNRADFVLMNDFLKKVLPKGSERGLRWMLLDNAAKIYPASATSRWTNIYRLSATLKEDVDKDILQSALDVTVHRFPSIAVRLRRGTFWYYLEQIKRAPDIQEEKCYPLVRMPFDDIRSCAFRVIVYKSRIAVEFFHALTDGNGGLIFLKTLVAEYLTQKYGAKIPATDGVLDRLEEPKEEELTDDFPKNKAKVGYSRREADAYKILGEVEADGFCHNVTLMIKSEELLNLAHSWGVTVTALMTAVFIQASAALQAKDYPTLRGRKPVKVLVPVDLRRVFGSKTLRNFALYITPGIDTRLGSYTVEEIANIVAGRMKLEITKKNLSARIYTNVHDEERMLLKLTPLFLKNLVMKAVFLAVGERKSTLTLSNLGAVKLPEEMKKYVERFDFVLSVQQSSPYNAGLVSYGDYSYVNIIRNIKEPRLEYEVYKVLRDLGIHVKVESNSK